MQIQYLISLIHTMSLSDMRIWSLTQQLEIDKDAPLIRSTKALIPLIQSIKASILTSTSSFNVIWSIISIFTKEIEHSLYNKKYCR